MKYTLDTEFWEQDYKHPTQLISLGIVAEDGRTLYAINKEFDWRTVPQKHWLRENVMGNLDDPRIRGYRPLRTYQLMKHELIEFFKDDKDIEIWTYFGSYDWSLFCQIFGTMLTLPEGFPHMPLDINQERKSWGFSRDIFPVQQTPEHNALNDAWWTMDCVKAVWAKKLKVVDRIHLGGL